MKKNINIGIIQFNISWNDKSSNIGKIQEYISTLSNETDLILLPEMFDTGFVTDVSILNDDQNELTKEWILQTAKKNNTAIGGTIIIKDNGKYFNRFVFALADGTVYEYDKRHLFAISGENKYISNGNKRTIAKIYDWRFNLLICYDLRFPVWARNKQDYDVLLYPANWPISRIEQWKALLIARAIENQAYCIGINRTGIDEHGYQYPGMSLVINPKGEIMHQASDKDEIFTVELDYEYFHKLRTNFPVIDDADKFEFTDL